MLISLLLLASACNQNTNVTSKPTQEISQTTPDQNEVDASQNQDQVNIQSYDTEQTEKPSAFIIPESSKRLITSDDVLGYDASLLQLAVNEIYARHGYVFQKDYLNSYFRQKSWYQASDNFSESDFSDIEKANITFLKNHSPEKSSTTITIDTDGDSLVEVFNVSPDLYARTDYGQGYIDDMYSDDYAGSLITDLDINDGEMEVIAYDNGPSCDFTLDVLKPLDENHFKEIQKFTSQYYDHEMDSNGHVTFELFDQMVYATADYTYEKGQFVQGTIHYPVFTVAQATDHLHVGDKVIFKGTGFKEDGSMETLTVQFFDPESQSLIESHDFGDDFNAYMVFLSSTLKEMDYMYYGD